MPLSNLTAEELRQLIRGTAVATWSLSRDGLSLEPAQWTELTGQTLEQMHGDGWLDAVNPEDRDRVVAAWATSISHEQHFNTDYRIRCSDNVYRWFNVRGVPLRSTNGELELWVGLFLEIPGGSRFRDKVREQTVEANGDLHAQLRPAQLRAARALLNWSAAELSSRCGVSISTIRRFEQDDSSSRLRGRSSSRITECLQNAGVGITRGDDGSLDVKWAGHST